MRSKQGRCDWCSKYDLLIRHDYIDGKYHHSCKGCEDIAAIDVLIFNNEERAAMITASKQANQ